MIFVWIGAWIDSLLKPKRGRDPPHIRKRRAEEIKKLRQARKKRLDREKEDKQNRPEWPVFLCIEILLFLYMRLLCAWLDQN